MPCWYYDKRELRDTPSILDGITFDTERRYRKEGARFIITCGTSMGLGHSTMATGVVYFHRFYMFHSFKSFPRYVTACCCLFLAGKVEETPKKCKDIIKAARQLLADSYFVSFGEDPKEEVMTLERILLQTIKFDLQVEHPYTFLLKYAKCLKGDQSKLQKVVQMAWNFVNDSLSTVVCLQWEPEIIAVALIHLASKLSKFTVADWVGRQPQHVRWWDMFVLDVTMEIIEDICHQVLDLYQNQKEASEQASPPQKPPSRADSPQTLAKASVAMATPQKGRPPPMTAPGAVMPNNGSGAELSNIQTIKSLANTMPPHMAAHMPNNDAMSSTSAAAAGMQTAYHHHMYAPPPPPNVHSMYATVQPPLPPPPPYGALPPSNSWAPAMAPPPPMPHYGAPLPPGPMPPMGPTHRPPPQPSHNHHGGGYYTSGGSSSSYRQRY